MRVIIAGSRDFKDYELLKNKCDKILKNQKNVLILSGKAEGADTLGEWYAKERGHTLIEFPAKWDKFGRSAGIKRNIEMSKNADALICFWDGSSKGSKHMISVAKEKNLKIRIILFK